MLGTLDWEQPAAVIVNQIAAAAATPDPLFSYLKGVRVEFLGATLAPAAPAGEPSPRLEPGSLVAVEADGAFVVVAGDGEGVRIPRARLKFYIYETEDLPAVLKTFGLALPQRLSRVYYLDNRDSTAWERGTRAWEDPTLDWRAVEPLSGQPHPSRAEIEPNEPFFRWLLTRLQVPSGGWCLDIGCGDGWAMAVLAELGYQVAGFDVAPAALAVARRYVPGADLAELDYYEAGDHYARAGRQSDFMFCRNLGVAQKVVDWSEPAWIEATRKLADRLTPGGVLYWTQLSDRSGLTTAEGMTNPPLHTMVAYFRAAGLWPLGVSVFGSLYVLVLVRPEFPHARERAFHAANARDWREALARFRASAAATPDEEPVESDRAAIVNAFRAACLHLSSLFLQPGADDQHRLLIAGTDHVARLYARAAWVLRMPMVGYWSPAGGEEVEDLTALTVGRLPAAPAERPTAIVVADPRLAPAVAAAETALAPPVAVLNLWALAPDSASAPAEPGPTIYSHTGDQDRNLVPTIRRYLLGVAHWEDEATAEPAAALADAAVADAAAEQESGMAEEPASVQTEVSAVFPGWQVQGAGRLSLAGDALRMVALAGESALLRSPAQSGPPRDDVLFSVEVQRHSGLYNDCRIAVTAGDRCAIIVVEPSTVWLALSEQEATEAPPADQPARGHALRTADWHRYGLRLGTEQAELSVDGFVVQTRRLPSRAASSPWAVTLGIWDDNSADSEAWWRNPVFGAAAGAPRGDMQTGSV